MRILICGGSGLIGRELAQALTGEGHEVWILTRHPNSPQLAGGARFAAWDGITPAGWSQLLDGAGAIINLAGENIGAAPWTADRLRRIRESRINAGRAIVEGLKNAHNRPGLLIQQSAIGCYGTSLSQTFDETAPFGADILSGICADWEGATGPAEDLGMRRIVLRTGLYLTRDGGVLTRLMLPFRLFAGGPLGDGRQWYSWIHHADWLAAVLFLLSEPDAKGIYNLTAPEPVTNAEFGRTLAWIMRRPYLLPAPSFALRMALGKMSSMVLDGQKVVPRRLQEAGFQFKFPKLHAALEDILKT